MGGFVKHDDGKARLSLIPADALAEVARVLAHGAEKYDEFNWAKCDDPRRFLDAALRHGFACGEDLRREDPESGLMHAAHMTASALLFLALLLRERGVATVSWRAEIQEPK